MFLLDTNVVSELRRPARADANVLAWARAHAVTDFHLSTISILELEIGTLRLARKDADQAETLRRWIDSVVLAQFERRIHPVDIAVAQRCTRMRAPHPRADRDALIAATAAVHGMTVVTRNDQDFERLGVPILNPWTVPT